MAVLRDAADPRGRPAGRRGGRGGVLGPQAYRAVGRLAQPGQHRDQRLLAVAGHARDGDDFMFMHHQVQAIQPQGAVAAVAYVDLRQRHHGRGLLGRRHGFGVRHDDLAAHHQFRKLRGAGAGGIAFGDQLALAQHGHAARHGHHFVQLVRNEDHGQAFVDEAAQGGEQVLHFLRREHGGGFVQDQHAGAAVERLQDFDPLFLADGQRADPRVRIHAQAETLAQLDQALARPAAA
ncbi:hypothetical protein D9M68_590910 [compost metagenome]